MAQQTPKEKAEELVNRFAKLPEEGTLMWYLSFEIAKKCAIIAVDEILVNFAWEKSAMKFWQEVKQEIEKL
jgi:hypothetical protein